MLEVRNQHTNDFVQSEQHLIAVPQSDPQSLEVG
jgi:hypothetical protein